MNLDQFIENFADLFDETDPDTIQALSVIAMIDEEYDVEFRGDDIRGSSTVKDLYDIVETRVEEEE